MATVFILIIGLLLGIINGMYWRIQKLKYESFRNRNKAVIYFRHWVGRIRPDIYETLPSYQEMLHDDKEISEKTYCPELLEPAKPLITP